MNREGGGAFYMKHSNVISSDMGNKTEAPYSAEAVGGEASAPLHNSNQPPENMPRQRGAGTTSDALPAGTELQNGAFRISRVLARGDVGITYLSRNVALHRDVVLKEFFPRGASRAVSGSSNSGSSDKPFSVSSHAVVPSAGLGEHVYQQACAAFLEKSRVVSRVWHPNVVMVYDTFTANNTAYMVMKLLKGKTLQQFLEEQLAQKRFLPEAQALAYGMHIGRGLEALHKAGLVHGDLRPAKVMLCPPTESALEHDTSGVNRRAPLPRVPTDQWTLAGQRIVLLDCGLKRLPLVNDGTQTLWLNEPQRSGQCQYAPPELFGRSRDHDQSRENEPTTDVYALGATLYHMLTGQTPVDALMRAHGTVLPPPHRVNAHVSAALSEIVMWALELRSEHRPQTIDAFTKQLSQCGGDVSPAAAPKAAAPKEPAPPIGKRAAVQMPAALNRAAASASIFRTAITTAPAPAAAPATATPPLAVVTPTAPIETQPSKAMPPSDNVRQRRSSGRHLALAALLGTTIAGTAAWALWRESTTLPPPAVPNVQKRTARAEDAPPPTTAVAAPPTVAVAPQPESKPVERSLPVQRSLPVTNRKRRHIGNATISVARLPASREPSRKAARRLAAQWPDAKPARQERLRIEATETSQDNERTVARRRSRRILRRLRERDSDATQSNSTEVRDAPEVRGTPEVRDTRRNFRQRRREYTNRPSLRVVRNTPARRRLRRTLREAGLPPLPEMTHSEPRSNEARPEAGLPPM